MPDPSTPVPGAPKAPPVEPTAEITPPVLEHFEPAEYPPEALEAGLEADVVLRLTVGADGRVTEAELVEPAGHGFDEAARSASLRFRFRPATRSGSPAVANIDYRYMFRLPEAPEPAPAKPNPGTLTGTLVTQEGENPIPGARVVARSTDGKELVTTTDDEGRWRFEDVLAGDYRVLFEAPGFEALERSVSVPAGDAVALQGRLVPRGDAIEITVLGTRPERELTKRTLEQREIDRIPGTGGDALRSLQNLPGVARPPALAGLLIVRGAAPQDSLTFVDGANVPLIYHFGGISSVVPTELLDRIDFYPGNFGVRYGQAMGSIVDVGLARPNTRCFEDYGKPTNRDGCYHGLFQVDLIDTRLLVQGPIGASKHWRFAIGGRRSWIDTWLKPVLEEAGTSVTSAPVYYDYQVIVDHEPSRDAKLSLRFYGSNDRFEILVEDPAAQDPAFGGNLTLGTTFYLAQALYEDQLSSDVELRSMFSAGRTRIDFGLGPFLFDLTVYPITLRNEFGFRLARGVRANLGMDMVATPFDVLVRAPQPPRPGEPSPGPFVTQQAFESRQASTSFRPAWYADVELEPTERLRLVPGARVDYARDSGHADFSPRILARYDLIQNDELAGVYRRTTLKGGVGLFHQPPQFQETDPVFGTEGLLSNRALHYSLGVEREFTRNVELSVEGFYKDLTRLVSRDQTPSGGFVYDNDGTGQALGLETLLKYKPDERFFAWMSYTLSRSVRQDDVDEAERRFEFDQPHNLVVLGSYRIGRGWEVGARFRVISGSLTTPVLPPPALPALYVADAGSYVPLQGQPFSRRLPVFHQLDVRIDKRWQFRTWRLSAFLDLQNAYNNQAVEALVYNYDFSRERFQTGLPIIPSIGMRGEF